MFKNIRGFLLLLTLFLSMACVQKRIWQGQYITIKTNELPKEDFKAGNYIVVAYAPQEYDKKSKVIYRFDIMQDGKRVRLIEFSECFLLITQKPELNKNDKGKNYDYALTEINPEDFGKMQHFSLIRGTTYKLYEKLHSYEEIKQEVIDVILGRELLPEY